MDNTYSKTSENQTVMRPIKYLDYLKNAIFCPAGATYITNINIPLVKIC